MNRAFLVHRSAVLTLAALAISCTIASASVPVGDRAGVWSMQTVESTMTTASGVKTGVDLGPARAAALGHLDSDGVVDLVVAYGTAKNAYAAVTLGDPRFRFGAKHDRVRMLDGLPPERPFASESVVYPLPFAPDWAAVGDWDADGDFDVVFAAHGLAQLYWMAGDGQAGLDAGHMITLSGGVTAFTSAEVNRRDGLNDLVVAVHGATGADLLVFESPLGALRGDPERHVMPVPVTALAVEWFDDDGWPDIAAATGNTVVIVSGRDRKLVLGREKREAVPSAETTALDFKSRVTGLAAGDFVGHDRRTQLAVRHADGQVTLVRRVDEEFQRSELGTLAAEGTMTSARSSGLPGHDLVVFGSSQDRVEIFHAETAKSTAIRLEPVPAPESVVSALTIGRLNLDTRDDLVLLREDGAVEVAATKTRLALVVTTTDDLDDGTCDGTHCSFREAINEANAQVSGSTITFDLGIGATIEPTSSLPALTQTAATTIDGTVTSGVLTGLLRIQGASAGSSAIGLRFRGGNTTVSNFLIGGFGGEGIELRSGANNLITGCRIGLDNTGGNADPNENGILIFDSDDNVIGGTATGEGNVISGNVVGVKFSGTSIGSALEGNLIGLDINGTMAVGNSTGVKAFQNDGIDLGSTNPGGGNVISGNSVNGIAITGSSDPGAAPWLIQANIIGLDRTGSSAVPNNNGLFIEETTSATVGGTTTGARNLISGSGAYGIRIYQGSVFTQVLGNYIGTDVSGTFGIGNDRGIDLARDEETSIGGTIAGAGNLICASENEGIVIGSLPPTSHAEILGNHIGLGADGTVLGNRYGIYMNRGAFITIGTAEAPNSIAASTENGIAMTQDTAGVSIGPNSIYGNGILGIDLGDNGVTPNDPLDPDTGPNGLQNFPEIEFVDAATGDVDFYVHSKPSTTYEVLFFENPACDDSGYGEGRSYLGSTTVTTEASGTVSDQVTLGPLSGGAVITATATDPAGNTSEFSMCFDIPYPPGHIFSDGFEGGDISAWN